ncbi:hypothetical protein AV650_05720 [Serratia fonticola]|nr:hypothetical protein AV650_05720 [Serratia fonticola]
MMNGRCRSFIVLLYLCFALFIMLFIITMSFSLLGYWIGVGGIYFRFLLVNYLLILKWLFLGY